jgi:hypothetical protein
MYLHVDASGTFYADVKGMRFENNTIYIAKPAFAYDDAIKWGPSATMTPGILTMKNNIIVTSNYSTIMANDHPGAPGMSNNVFWNVQGSNIVGKTLGTGDKFADPQFVGAWQNLRIQSSSPAVNNAAALAPPPSPFTDPHQDLDGRSFFGAPDAGAYEYGSTSPTSPSAPAIVTTGTAAITYSGAELDGTVNPNGYSTAYHFDFGLTSTYGSSTPALNAGAGSVAVAVNSTVSALVPGTVYHFRLVGTNTGGTTSGTDRTFTTAIAPPAMAPPTVATTSAASITATGAQLNGTVNPNGHSSTYHFEYGPTNTYGSSTPSGDAGSTMVPLSVAATLANLTNGTTYHYRLVAVNAGGTIAGSDSIFTSGHATETVVNGVPAETCDLKQNYPNPFNPSTRIDFVLLAGADASLKVYNTLGVEVLTLVSGFQAAGRHSVQWNAAGVASGVYFCTLQSGGTLSTRRMILLK